MRSNNFIQTPTHLKIGTIGRVDDTPQVRKKGVFMECRTSAIGRTETIVLNPSEYNNLSHQVPT